MNHQRSIAFSTGKSQHGFLSKSLGLTNQVLHKNKQ